MTTCKLLFTGQGMEMLSLSPHTMVQGFQISWVGLSTLLPARCSAPGGVLTLADLHGQGNEE